MPPQAASVLPFGEQIVDLPRRGRAAVEHLLRAPPLSWRWSTPRAPWYPKPPRARSAGRRSGPGPTQPSLPPRANPLIPQVLPRDEEGLVRRLAMRPAASPFFGEGVERQGERGVGLVGGNVDLGPGVLGEPVDAVAPLVVPSVADVLAARRVRSGSAAGAAPPGPARP